MRSYSSVRITFSRCDVCASTWSLNTQRGWQLVLNHVPPLQDLLGLGSIHLAGDRTFVLTIVACEKSPPPPTAFAPPAKRSAPQHECCKRL